MVHEAEVVIMHAECLGSHSCSCSETPSDAQIACVERQVPRTSAEAWKAQCRAEVVVSNTQLRIGRLECGVTPNNDSSQAWDEAIETSGV
jgi:hypothetical protein